MYVRMYKCSVEVCDDYVHTYVQDAKFVLRQHINLSAWLSFTSTVPQKEKSACRRSWKVAERVDIFGSNSIRDKKWT
jgi:hypothetical protein